MEKVIVISSDKMGSEDEELGRKLLGLFFTKLRMLDTRPDAMVFYNTGVRLLAQGSPVLDSVEGLFGDGVDLMACGTCVSYYGLEDKITVGRISNMQEILDLLMKARSVLRF